MRAFKTFIKFSIVGASGTIVNLLVFNILLFSVFFSKHYIINNTISFLFAVTNNFYWNNKWTYRSKGRGKTLHSKYLQFFIIGLLTLAANNMILHMLVEHFTFNKRLGNLCAILFCSFFNFIANTTITFKDKAS